MKEEKLKDLVREFASKQSKSFEFEALAEFVEGKKMSFDDDLLFGLACKSDYLFEDDSDGYLDRFYPRHHFFQGAEFWVTPIQQELDGGFLLPGHRFGPFIPRDIFPADAMLKRADGTPVSTRTEQISHAVAERCLIYFGTYGMTDYMVTDHESNAARLIPPYENALELTVFDLKDFFDSCNFKLGDSLMLTVEDWLRGVYSIQHVSAEAGRADFSHAQAWTKALRRGLDNSREEEDLGCDCCEQMARMLWLAEGLYEGSSVLRNVPMSMASFFKMQKDLTLETIGNVCFFWPKGESVQGRAVNSMIGAVEEPVSELDAILKDLGVSVDVEEAEAYMRDALSRGETCSKDPLARVIQGRTLWFNSAEDQNEFDRLWDELWEDVRKNYSVIGDVHRESRAIFLNLNDRCLEILRTLDQGEVDPLQFMNHPAAMQLGELSGMIHSALMIFNQNENDDGLNLPLSEVAADLSRIIDDLAQELLQAKQAEEASSQAVYQLKISLKGAKPPIWRRVLVSAGMSLDQLHVVIQTVFDWDNSHLHMFVKDRTGYEPGGGELGDSEDSFSWAVGDLLTKEKDKLLYEYDFGDSWRHDILLEKIVEPTPGQQLPVCIKGMRACPPEDCGGLYGYYEMLEAGDESFDPEAFSLKDVNARFRP